MHTKKQSLVMKKRSKHNEPLPTSLVSQHPLSVNGPRMVPLNSVQPLEAIDDLTYRVCGCPDESIIYHSPSRKRKSLSSPPREESTAESLSGSRKTTSSDRLVHYRNSFRTTLCSATSVVDSNTNVRGSRGFWSKSKEDWSTKLWLPTRTDSLGSAPSSLNGFFNEPVHGSSFSIKRVIPRLGWSLRLRAQAPHVILLALHIAFVLVHKPTCNPKRTGLR